MKIQTILATKGTRVLTARASQTLDAVAAEMAQHNVGALVVVDDAGRPVGIISERDILRALARREDFARPVSAAMTRAVIVGSPQDDVASVMKTMTERRFRHLPIMEGDKLVGIVSIGDMVKAQLEQYQGEIETLETQIIGG